MLTALKNILYKCISAREPKAILKVVLLFWNLKSQAAFQAAGSKQTCILLKNSIMGAGST
jgi:hypothetical protein